MIIALIIVNEDERHRLSIDMQTNLDHHPPDHDNRNWRYLTALMEIATNIDATTITYAVRRHLRRTAQAPASPPDRNDP